jgi:hypothetical protein
MSQYLFTVQARKYSDPHWLPIACPTRESADAMIDECLYGSGGYHIVRVSKRVGDSNVFRVIETHDVRDSFVPAEDGCTC